MNQKENRKKTRRWVLWTAILLGVAALMGMMNREQKNAATIGIIGGADGPTAIFVTGPSWSSEALTKVLAVVCIAGVIWLIHRIKCKQ